MRARSSKQRGIAIIMTAIALTLVLFMVAMAVDASYLYTVKAKLSASCDAAALAAARSLNVGLSMAEQEASARARAQAFFNANFPDGALNTRGRSVNIEVAETALRTRTVSVRASVRAPTYFLRMAGFNQIDVNAEGTASRRDVNLILVLDRSGSMANSGSCTPMKDAASAFVANFAEARDRLAMISFSGAWNLSYAPSKNFKTSSPTLDSVIGSISCVGGTNSATAISEAYNQIAAINEPGALNLILFFTDGNPTGLSGTFKIRRYSDVYSKSTCYDIHGHSNANSDWFNSVQDRTGVLIGLGNKPSDSPTSRPYGLYNRSVASPSDIDVIINGPTNSDTSKRGCAFSSSVANSYRDVAYVPDYDYYNNYTRAGYYSGLPNFSSGAYSGKIRSDRSDSVIMAATNATDSAAKRIRQDSNLNPVFYVIGLGNNVDATLLKRVANDPASPTYTSAEPTGMYVFAPDKTQLNQAFARIASEILRLSR